jgi:phosphatidylglycerol:prolipoprotein diacylglycerol transferase
MYALREGRPQGLTIDIDPVVGRLGPLTFRWYGLIMALAVIVGVWIFSRQLKRRGISSNHALGIALIAVPCGVIGARLFHVFDNFSFYWHNPGQIFGGALVGLAIYGVIAGGIFGLVIYCRWKKLPVLRVLDATALAFPWPRCRSVREHHQRRYRGPPTTSFAYSSTRSLAPDLLGVPTHPTPVYEQIWLLIMLGVLLYAVPRLKIDGLAFLLYIGLYSLGRFFISYYRVNNIIFLGMREAQLFALAGIIIASVGAFILVRRARDHGVAAK